MYIRTHTGGRGGWFANPCKPEPTEAKRSTHKTTLLETHTNPTNPTTPTTIHRWQSEIKFSPDYRKVPIARLQGKDGEEGEVVRDSSAIVDRVAALLRQVMTVNGRGLGGWVVYVDFIFTVIPTDIVCHHVHGIYPPTDPPADTPPHSTATTTMAGARRPGRGAGCLLLPRGQPVRVCSCWWWCCCCFLLLVCRAVLACACCRPLGLRVRCFTHLPPQTKSTPIHHPLPITNTQLTNSTITPQKPSGGRRGRTWSWRCCSFPTSPGASPRASRPSPTSRCVCPGAVGWVGVDGGDFGGVGRVVSVQSASADGWVCGGCWPPCCVGSPSPSME